MKTPAEHFRTVENEINAHNHGDAPYMDAPFDWTAEQGDMAPVFRRVQSFLFKAALVMFGWFAGSLMALATLRGWW